MTIRKLELRKRSVFLKNKIFRSQVLIFGTFITGIVVAVKSLGLLQSLELRAFDLMCRAMLVGEHDSRMLVVAVTEADIKELGTWPMSDTTLATVLENIQAREPAMIGLDLYRDISYPPGQEKLKMQLQADNLVAIAKLPSSGEIGVSSPVGTLEERVGFNDVILDPDGVVRRHLMFGSFEGNYSALLPYRLPLAIYKHPIKRCQ